MLEDLPSELDRGPLDPARIFAALERHEVEYLTIGGVAVNAHGHAVGLDDLIRLKRESGRDRDLEDVATLLAARRARGLPD